MAPDNIVTLTRLHLHLLNNGINRRTLSIAIKVFTGRMLLTDMQHVSVTVDGGGGGARANSPL